MLQLIKALSKNKGVLIYDVNNEDAYRQFPKMEFKNLPRWKSTGVYRIFHPDTDSFIDAIPANVYNACVVLEDATAYVNSNIQESLNWLLVDRRHRNVDLILTFHSFRVIPPKVLDKCNYIIVGKTGDAEKYLKNLEKLPNPEEFMKVWQRVMKHESNFYREVVATNA
ncbi:hypothetical protein [Xanthocytophaga agilis]|uniref:Uncharacterized protein n=1 Tax=Xanthocytophaga agilis TaxID=3048010 RepID=A0AAE3RC75_9BACT|nr:hypothetical protein [Xanthocytophaga agilis]MDJ1505012.1 hypothetical protein [Xanthocytophaga agilis]